MVNYKGRPNAVYSRESRIYLVIETNRGELGLLLSPLYSPKPQPVFLTREEAIDFKKSRGVHSAGDLAGEFVQRIVHRQGCRETTVAIF